VSTTSDHEPTGAPAGDRPSSTQEIPVVPTPLEAAQPTGPVDFVPGIPGAGTLPPPPPPPVHAAPVHAAPVQAAPAPAAPPTPVAATGPAAEPGTDAPPTAPAPDWPQSLDDGATAKPGKTRKVRAPRSPRHRAALLGLGLAVLALVLLEIGLVLPFGTVSLWSAVTLWSAFATLSGTVALLAFAAFYPAGNRLRSSAVWKLAAAGLVGGCRSSGCWSSCPGSPATADSS
jgi:hypothetical protein